MRTNQKRPNSIDEYIACFPTEVQEILEKIRMTIKRVAPDAAEAISYQIPAFNLRGRYLVYFAAYEKHVALYPSPGKNPAFKEDVSAYASGKATLRFALDKPIPLALIGKIVKFMVTENLKKPETKRRKK